MAATQAEIPVPITTAAGTSAAARPAPGPRTTISEIIEDQEQIFSARQPESRRLAGLAAGSLAGGVTSSWQITRPQAVWLSHGSGSKIYDVDGTEYVDMHGGYGVSDRKSTRLNSSHSRRSRMPSSA